MTAKTDVNIDQLRQVILDYFAGYNIKVYLVGSRAKGAARKTSDVDIAILPLETLEPGVIAELQDILEESTIPYTVDIINLAEVDYEFRDRVLAGAQLWKG